jgi:hypothetical protein
MLESLWLTWHDAPGTLGGAAVPREFPRLARLTLTDAYGLDAGPAGDWFDRWRDF